MLQTRPLFELRAEVAAPQAVPGGPYGARRYIPVTGGRFVGDRIAGRLLPGGADCQLIRPDGVAELDVRVSLEAEDGTVVFMKGLGMRHGPADVMDRMARGEAVDREAYYFREALFFEAPEGPHAWLNRVLAVGVGERRPDTVLIEALELL